MSIEEKRRELLASLSTVYRLGKEGREADLPELADAILADHGVGLPGEPEPDAWRVVHRDPEWEHPDPNEHASPEDAEAEARDIFGTESEEWEWDGGKEREEPEPRREDYRVVPVWIGRAPSQGEWEAIEGAIGAYALAQQLHADIGSDDTLASVNIKRLELRRLIQPTSLSGELKPWMPEHVRLMVKSLRCYRDLDLGYSGEVGGEEIAAAIQSALALPGEIERTPEEPKRPLPTWPPGEQEGGPRSLVVAAAISLLFVALALALWFLA